MSARGCTRALTDNYQPVEVGQILLANELIDVQVTQIDPSGTLLADMNAANLAVAS